MTVLLIHKHTNASYNELSQWRKNKNIQGTSFNFDTKLGKHVPEKTPIFIIDTNNDTNTIEGIGIIYKTKIKKMYKYNIYSNRERNRYSYKSPFYIVRKEAMQLNAKSAICIRFLEYVIFYGRKNYKRMENKLVYFNQDLILYADSLFCKKNNNHIYDKITKNTSLLNYFDRYFDYLLMRFKVLRSSQKKIPKKTELKKMHHKNTQHNNTNHSP